MFVIDQVILLAAILILIGIVASKISARVGLPVLVLFLMIGMLAGEGGIGGIIFDSPGAAHALGTLALAIILFDGGLQTPFPSIKVVWKPSALLATLGVLVTALITGLAAAFVFDLPLLEGMLIGAIVGSTDAAAVFSLLRNAGIHIKPRIKSTLEVESASNDPMAIFLTVGLLEVLLNDMPLGAGLFMMFVQQMGIGAIIGLGVGWIAIRVINHIHLTASGLYPVLVAATGLLSFGLSAYLGGSGFLAIFLAGVVIGNSQFVFQRSTFLFHDGLAWLSQITMFVVLGLLIEPAALLDVWLEGLVIAFVLVFVARPIAVIPILALFGFKRNEIALVSWVGLRGSVPIILAIFPLIFGLPSAPLIFNVVFFVVLISATAQGSTLPIVARKLGLAEPPPALPAATLEITALGDIDAEIVEYTLAADSRAAGKRLSKMALPDSAVVAMISRNNTAITPRGSTVLEAGDHLFVVLHSDTREFVDRVFSQASELEEEFPNAELRVRGSTAAEDVQRSYGINLGLANDRTTLDQLFHRELEHEPIVGSSLTLNDVTLYVRYMIGKRIATVGVVPNPPLQEEV